jgi:chromosome segregation ATPase
VSAPLTAEEAIKALTVLSLKWQGFPSIPGSLKWSRDGLDAISALQARLREVEADHEERRLRCNARIDELLQRAEKAETERDRLAEELRKSDSELHHTFQHRKRAEAERDEWENNAHHQWNQTGKAEARGGRT